MRTISVSRAPKSSCKSRAIRRPLALQCLLHPQSLQLLFKASARRPGEGANHPGDARHARERPAPSATPISAAQPVMPAPRVLHANGRRRRRPSPETGIRPAAIDCNRPLFASRRPPSRRPSLPACAGIAATEATSGLGRCSETQTGARLTAPAVPPFHLTPIPPHPPLRTRSTHRALAARQ